MDKTDEAYRPCEGCDVPRRISAVENDLTEIKAELHDIRMHDRRQDKLLMDLQVEIRAGNKAVLEKLAYVVDLVKKGRKS